MADTIREHFRLKANVRLNNQKCTLQNLKGQTKRIIRISLILTDIYVVPDLEVIFDTKTNFNWPNSDYNYSPTKKLFHIRW